MGHINELLKAADPFNTNSRSRDPRKVAVKDMWPLNKVLLCIYVPLHNLSEFSYACLDLLSFHSALVPDPL